METAETRIVQRYFRKTKAHPGGSVTHKPECEFLNLSVCTCSLLPDLRAIYAVNPEKARELYPLVDEELADHDRALASLAPGRNGKKR